MPCAGDLASKASPPGVSLANRVAGLYDHVIAARSTLGHRDTMSEQNSDFEQAAQIVEAFSESETDERILELLTRIAAAIRDQAIDN